MTSSSSARPVRRRQGLLLPGILVLLLLGACLPPSTGATTPPGLERAVGYSAPAWDRLLRQHEHALVGCMRSRGFKFWSEADWAYLTLGPHGLFGLGTPSAKLLYLRRYGYGITQRVHVLRSEIRDIREPSNQQYAQSLPRARREAYVRALVGGAGTTGCAQAARDDVVGRLGLPDGGPLGESFAKALAKARDSAQYRRWEGTVIDCLAGDGIEVEDHDLVTLERPFLLRLLRLAGSDYSVDDDGNIHYDLSSAQLSRISATDLRALHTAELATARAEARCRASAGAGAQAAVDRESAHLATEHPSEVAQLKRALEQFQDHN